VAISSNSRGEKYWMPSSFSSLCLPFDGEETSKTSTSPLLVSTKRFASRSSEVSTVSTFDPTFAHQRQPADAAVRLPQQHVMAHRLRARNSANELMSFAGRRHQAGECCQERTNSRSLPLVGLVCGGRGHAERLTRHRRTAWA
jgi:hypothetical protein